MRWETQPNLGSGIGRRSESSANCQIPGNSQLDLLHKFSQDVEQMCEYFAEDWAPAKAYGLAALKDADWRIPMDRNTSAWQDVMAAQNSTMIKDIKARFLKS